MTVFKRLMRPVPLSVMLALGGAGAMAFAQIEGGDRGVAPIDSSTDFEVDGIHVDVAAKSAEVARFGGWREAQRQGWRMLWTKIHGSAAPGLSDSQLDAIVAGIVIENEQISPNHYIATLGVLFDRVRAGQILGTTGLASRSAPLLVIPIEWSGGTPQSFETRTEWQKAWARFRSGSSAIDYVRPSGTGSDPLLLNYAQTGRPGRRWWRMLLDQYGAADVIMPQVRLERSWPGGPVTGYFSARYGPDGRPLPGFLLHADSSAGIPAMMDEGVKRLDRIFSDALAAGQLRPDVSLIIEQPVTAEDIPPPDEAAGTAEEVPNLPTEDVVTPTPLEVAKLSSYTIQFETPDVASVSSAESAVNAIPGVKSASTSSLALGGTSVMRVSFAGDIDTLKLGLSSHGFSVKEAGGVIRISR